MSHRSHKQVVSIQTAAGAIGNSGVTLASSATQVVITKHSAFIATASNESTVSGVTFTPIFYTPSGVTLQGNAMHVAKAVSPEQIDVRLHSFIGLTGGSITFLA